jgi:MarR family transcriptional regulator, organic hydroperoxide resistance regulator
MTGKNGARQRPRAKRKAAFSALPPTTSRRALLKGGSDHDFRVLVADLLTISSRMETVRGHLGARMDVSGPQYSVLIAIAHLQGDDGVSVSALAKALHVSNAFIASETGKLAQRGFLHKRTNPHDRRGILLSIAPAGRIEIGKIGDEIRAINDLFFGALDAKAFAALSKAVGALVHSSRTAIHYVSAEEPEKLEAAE